MADVNGLLFEWEMEINRKFPLMPYLSVKNNVDDEGPPHDFNFVCNCVSNSVDLRSKAILGCECNDCSGSGKCCPTLANPRYKLPYNKNGLLNLRPGKPIYECNSLCKCSKNCPNRVVQHGTKLRMQIFKTANNRGWGLRTLENIKKGQFVVEYVGEILIHEEVDVRENIYDYETCSYLFDLDFGESDSPYIIDAAHFGNASRFINHSCSPNLEAYPVYIEQLDPRLPRLALFAQQDISSGEELTFDYKMSKNKSRHKQRVKCMCGSNNCRKYL